MGRAAPKSSLLSQGDLSLYRQVETLLREQIAHGELRPGARLPTEAALCACYGVSRATVRQALDALERDALIRRHAGRGTFVRASSISQETDRTPLTLAEAIALAGEAERVVRKGRAPAPVPVARLLGCAPDEEVGFVIRVSRRRPVVAVKRYGAEVGAGRIERAWVEAISAEPRFAMMLKAQLGAPLLSLWWVEQGRAGPAAVCQMLLPASSFALAFEGDRS